MAFDDPLRTLAGDLAERSATTAGERRAARWLIHTIRRQTAQVWSEPFYSFRSSRSAWLLVLGLALAGGVLVWLAPVAGVGLTLVAALGFAAQALGWLELGWLFPGGESQNVVGVIPSRGEIRARVVVVAHYDTGRRIWRWPVFVGVGLAVSLLPLFAMLGTLLRGPLWDALLLVPLAGVAVGLAAQMRPGEAAGNDAGVAAALAVGRLEPLQHTEVWTLFTGSRAPGMVGIRAFLRRHGRLLANARFVILEENAGTGATLWQRRGEASVVAECGYQAVALLTVDPIDIQGAAAHVRAIVEEVDRAAILEA